MVSVSAFCSLKQLKVLASGEKCNKAVQNIFFLQLKAAKSTRFCFFAVKNVIKRFEPYFFEAGVVSIPA